MPAASANGITIEYETFGDQADPPVLLIMGFGGQLTLWDPGFCAALAASGLYVIRYDNRDVGLSTWFDAAGEPELVQLLSGTATAPYSLGDMAADAAGLLDALGIPSAHIVGVSMGGMIAQTFALEFPGRTRTLTSIMSTTGDPTVGQPRPEALAALVPVPPISREEAMDQGAVMWRTIGSPGFPFDEPAVRERAGAAYDRAFHPAGNTRHRDPARPHAGAGIGDGTDAGGPRRGRSAGGPVGRQGDGGSRARRPAAPGARDGP
jgi:pimeloyl-ACP methyl ester carboxylesterase